MQIAARLADRERSKSAVVRVRTTITGSLWHGDQQEPRGPLSLTTVRLSLSAALAAHSCQTDDMVVSRARFLWQPLSSHGSEKGRLPPQILDNVSQTHSYRRQSCDRDRY